MKKGFHMAIIIASIIVIAFIMSQISNSMTISGSVSSTGQVSFNFNNYKPQINISSPENKTYEFSKNEDLNLDLNVSSDREIDDWWFELYDKRFDEYDKKNVYFIPNTTFESVRGINNLTVYANSTDGAVGKKSVIFNVSVPNSAPIIENLSSINYACEKEKYSSNFSVNDSDRDKIKTSISDPDPFYIDPDETSGGEVIQNLELFSKRLNESHVGDYSPTISVDDQENLTCCVDYQKIGITVMETNDAPETTEIESRRLLINTSGEDFYNDLNVTDEEDNNETSDNISLSLSFSQEKLFNISDKGVMNYTANSSHKGYHEVQVCAEDGGPSDPHQNIDQCKYNSSRTSCEDFSLFIDEPSSRYFLWFYISDFYPKDQEQEVSQTQSIEFSVETENEYGDDTDVDWYLNSSKNESEKVEGGKNYTKEFKCDEPGNYTVEAVASDGDVSDSVDWNIEVPEKGCGDSSAGSSASGGGGGGSSQSESEPKEIQEEMCSEKWGCGNWRTCKEINEYTNLSEKQEMLEKCDRRGIENCGFQKRDCVDVNYCTTNKSKPSEVSICEYKENPTCDDRIQNCHSGSCEISVDCGGPCEPCPTCTDGVKNQGEEGVDCGGPCLSQCKEPIKDISDKIKGNVILIIIGLILLLLIIGIILWRKR